MTFVQLTSPQGVDYAVRINDIAKVTEKKGVLTLFYYGGETSQALMTIEQFMEAVNK